MLDPLHPCGCPNDETRPIKYGPCAKRRVVCTLTFHHDGMTTTVIAENRCANPQPVCPREVGEGYEKCRTICEQAGHAEQEAVKIAMSLGLFGGEARIEGHDHVCGGCIAMLKMLGCGDYKIGRTHL